MYKLINNKLFFVTTCLLLFSCNSIQHNQYPTTLNNEKHNKIVIEDSVTKSSIKINKVAFILPVSAESIALQNTVKMIYSGFFDAYIESQDTYEVRIFDSNNKPINLVYEIALKWGADIIIGPLLRNNVEEIAKIKLKKPTIVLNDLTLNNFKKNLFIFSASVSNEIDFAVEEAYRQGYRKPMVLYIDNAWGRSMANRFLYDWQQKTNNLPLSQSFTNKTDLPNAISQLVQVTNEMVENYKIFWRKYVNLRSKLEKKNKNIDDNLPEDLQQEKEYYKHHADGDFIYLISNNSNNARLVKPLLAFYLSNDLQIFSNSQIYKGYNNTLLDRDLDSVVFTDLPWILSQKLIAKRKSFKQNWNQYKDLFDRIYAYGYDLNKVLKNVSNKNYGKNISGTTGIITLQIESNKIVRKPSIAQFKNGSAIPILEFPYYYNK